MSHATRHRCEDGAETTLEDYLDEKIHDARGEDTSEFYRRVQEVSLNPRVEQIKELELIIINEYVPK